MSTCGAAGPATFATSRADELDPQVRDATLDTSVTVRNAGPRAPEQRHAALLDAGGKPVGAPVSNEGRLAGRPGAGRDVPGARAGAAQVVRRGAQPLHPAADAQGRAGQVLEVIPSRVGFRTVEIKDGAPGQRPAGALQGREPPRAQPRHRPLRRARADGARHRADEAAQHQRRSHLPLSERPGVVRALRPVRPLRPRRSQHREPRLRPRPENRLANDRPGRRRTSIASRGWSSATRTTRRS